MSYTPGPWELFKGEFYPIIRQKGIKNGVEIAHVGKEEDIEESEGVAGYHMNGAVARWDEFDCAQEIMDVVKKARSDR